MLATNNATLNGKLLSPKEVIDRYFTAFGSGDIEEALSLMCEDVIWRVDGNANVSTVGILKGRDRVRNWLNSFSKNFKPEYFKIDQSLVSKSTVVVLGHFRHRVLSTNNSVSGDFAIKFTVKYGLISHYHIFEDSALLSKAFDSATDWTKQSLRINDIVYSYIDIGEGPILFFSHGLFVDNKIFHSQISTLKTHYRCVIVDMPGHGQSGFRPEGWTLDDIAEDFACLVGELFIDPVTFVGQSQGGMVGLRMAARYPHLIENLILIGTSARAEFPERIKNWEALSMALVKGKEIDQEQAFVALQKSINATEKPNNNSTFNTVIQKTQFEPNGLAMAIEAAAIKRTDARALLSSIEAKTLVICGESDQATPIVLSEELASLIPNAQLEVLPNVGHHPPLEAPERMTNIIIRFLRDEFISYRIEIAPFRYTQKSQK